jgi:hypothetical protein
MNRICNLPLRVVTLPQAVIDAEDLSGDLEDLCREVAAVVHRDGHPHVAISLVGLANPREKERIAKRLRRWLIDAGVPARIIHVDGDNGVGARSPAWASAVSVFCAFAAEEYDEPRVLIALASDHEPALVH